MFVAAAGFAIGMFSRRNRTTTDAIEDVRKSTAEAIDDVKKAHAATADRMARRIDAVVEDTSATRADVAEIKGYLAAVQGDHFAFRRRDPDH